MLGTDRGSCPGRRQMGMSQKTAPATPAQVIDRRGAIGCRGRNCWRGLFMRVVHIDDGVCPTCGGAGGPDGTEVYPSLSQRDGAELARPADRAAGRVRSSRLIHPGATLVDSGIVNNVWECTDWLIVGRKTGHKLWWKDIA